MEHSQTHFNSVFVGRGVSDPFNLGLTGYSTSKGGETIMSKDRSIFNGYGKSSKNEAGKAQRYVVKETTTHFVLSVPSFGDTGNTLHGITQVTAVKVNDAGLAWLKTNLTLKDVKDRNRQSFTDARNNLAIIGKVKESLAAIKAGKATADDYSRVAKAMAQGSLGEALQTSISKALAKLA